MTTLQDKRLTIIHAATLLFSEKGFHATSIQEVADRSHVSKGTIYTYFDSKEELLLSIFKFFHENIQSHLEEASSSNLPIQEKLVEQIHILLRESLHYKPFFKMQHREQLISSHKIIQSYLIQSRMELFQWYESILKAVYGEAIEPYLPESAFLLDALISGFLRVVMIREDFLQIEETATYIKNRLDNMVQGLLVGREAPLFSASLVDQVKAKFSKSNLDSSDINKLLNLMETIINELDLNPEKKKELTSSLTYLVEELKNDASKKFLFKGLLSNFDGIQELQPHIKSLEELLQL